MKKERSKAYISVISEPISKLKEFSLAEVSKHFYNIFKLDGNVNNKKKKSKLRFPVEERNNKVD